VEVQYFAKDLNFKHDNRKGMFRLEEDNCQHQNMAPAEELFRLEMYRV
jgi:hypothetical protein